MRSGVSLICSLHAITLHYGIYFVKYYIKVIYNDLQTSLQPTFNPHEFCELVAALPGYAYYPGCIGYAPSLLARLQELLSLFVVGNWPNTLEFHLSIFTLDVYKVKIN